MESGADIRPMRVVYDRATALVSSSRDEGFGIPLAEALAMSVSASDQHGASAAPAWPEVSAAEALARRFRKGTLPA